MSQQIIFFRKNLADFEKTLVTVTASQGPETQANILDRSNRTAWGTSGSVDADNTNFVVDFGDIGTVDSILLVKHNFKNFVVAYFDPIGLVWTTISSQSGVTDKTSYFNFVGVLTQKIRVTITGTQVANADKTLCQFIATTKIGQFAGWPIIANPTIGRNIAEQRMLSGKSNVFNNVGFYNTSLTVDNLLNAADLSLIESLFGSSEGFLYWPCGGDQAQFSSVRQGYRLEDIFLVRCRNEFVPEFVGGIYVNGEKVQMDLAEVIT